MRRFLLAAGLGLGATVLSTTAAHAESAPTTTFTTPTWWPVVGAPVPGVGVEGTADDDLSGIASVRVTFCGNGSASITGDPDAGWSCGSGPAGLSRTYVVDAQVTCTTSARRSCTWVANAPLQPDHYLVFARATDLAGLTGPSPEPIVVVVV